MKTAATALLILTGLLLLSGCQSAPQAGQISPTVPFPIPGPIGAGDKYTRTPEPIY